MKPDELIFLRECQKTVHRIVGGEWIKGEAPMDVYERLGMNRKRAEYLCQKWVDKGWMECGVSARTGWLTDEGMAA